MQLVCNRVFIALGAMTGRCALVGPTREVRVPSMPLTPFHSSRNQLSCPIVGEAAVSGTRPPPSGALVRLSFRIEEAVRCC